MCERGLKRAQTAVVPIVALVEAVVALTVHSLVAFAAPVPSLLDASADHFQFAGLVFAIAVGLAALGRARANVSK